MLQLRQLFSMKQMPSDCIDVHILAAKTDNNGYKGKAGPGKLHRLGNLTFVSLISSGLKQSISCGSGWLCFSCVTGVSNSAI